MDAAKFIEERNRMCKSFNSLECKGCPAFNAYELSCAVGQESTMSATDQIDIVEKWSTANPRKTRQSVFLEQYPETIIDAFGALQICPMVISAAHRDSDGECKDPAKMCIDCRREFWMQEVE